MSVRRLDTSRLPENCPLGGPWPVTSRAVCRAQTKYMAMPFQVRLLPGILALAYLVLGLGSANPCMFWAATIVTHPTS